MKTRESQQLEAAVTLAEDVSQILEADRPTLQTLSVAINEQFINKTGADGVLSGRQLTRGFVNRRLTPLELVQEIDKGHAYGPHFNGSRNNENFVETSVISIDIDSKEGKPANIEGLLAEPFVRSYLGILYHTASSTPTNPRARLIFLLDKPISDPAFLVLAYRMLVAKLQAYGADKAPTAAASIFFGSKGSRPKLTTKVLPLQVLRDEVASWAATDPTDVRLICRSGEGGSDFLNGTDNGFYSIKENRKVFHPLPPSIEHSDISRWLGHIPSDPQYLPYSDWVVVVKAVFSAVGWDGLDLLKEWTTAKPGELEGMFRSFETNPRSDGTTWRTLRWMAEQRGWHPLYTLTADRYVNQQYVGSLSLTSKVTGIKSAKGTGKTEFIRSIVEDYPSVLSTGSRVSLLQANSKRLGLELYQDFGTDTPIRSQRLCVTPDSLWRLDRQHYRNVDLVFIDEADQFVEYLTSKTLKDRRTDILGILQFILHNAKHIVLLDADLTDTAVEFFKQVAHTNDVEIVVNTHPGKSWDYVEYAAAADLKVNLISTLTSDKRVYLASSSKQEVTELHYVISKQFPQKKGLLITADTAKDTSGSGEVTAFLKDPNACFHQYDWVAVSPALGTGVSIDVEGIEAVYLLGTANTLDHLELDQMAHRVRHPESGQCHFHISNQPYNPLTNDRVLKDSVLRKALGSEVTTEIDMLTGVEIVSQHPLNLIYTQLWSKLTARHNASLNRLGDWFKAYVIMQGHSISVGASAPADKAASLKNDFSEVRSLLEAEYVERVMNAEDISSYTCNNLISQPQRTLDESAAIERHDIKDLYGGDVVTPDLIKEFRKGRALMELIAFEERVLKPIEFLANSDGEDALSRFTPDHRRRVETALVWQTLVSMASGVDWREALHSDIKITGTTLRANGFHRWYGENKSKIQTLLGLTGRPGVTLVKDALRQVGLDLKGNQERKSSGGTITAYSFNDGNSFPINTKRGERIYRLTGFTEMSDRFQQRKARRQQQHAALDDAF